MTAVEDRLAEIETRARKNWPTSKDVATLAAALRAALEGHERITVLFGPGSAEDDCLVCLNGAWPCATYRDIAHALGVTL